MSKTILHQVFSSEAIAKSGTAYSHIINLSNASGHASLEITLTGDGTGKFEWVGTNDPSVSAASSFIKPAGVPDIVTAFTKTSGPGSDGHHVYSFSLSLVQRMAIKVTETGGSDTITVTGILAIQ